MVFPSLLIDISSWAQRIIIGLSARVGNPALRWWRPRVLCLWKSCAVLFFGDQSSGAMPASLAARVHSSNVRYSSAFRGKADISCSRTAHEARVVLKNHTRS